MKESLWVRLIAAENSLEMATGKNRGGGGYAGDDRGIAGVLQNILSLPILCSLSYGG